MEKIKKKFRQLMHGKQNPQVQIEQPQVRKTGLEILMEKSPYVLTNEERAKLTASCNDSGFIPKVERAGSVVEKNGKQYQVMHNGLLVKADGYYGKWMTDLITELKGHHEPQEEKVFYEILKRLENPKVLIELGAFWSYYSIWFTSQFQNAKAYCVEPDTSNLAVGRENALVNGLSSRMEFLHAAAGYGFGEKISFKSENAEMEEFIPLVSADWLATQYALDSIDILHLDIQGYELSALKAAEQTIRGGKLRFLFVSTHHYSISGDPMTHENCLNWILEHGGFIISTHNVLESYSGDGLIVASFDPRDRDFKVEVSRNTSSHSLFRSYEADLAILISSIQQNR